MKYWLFKTDPRNYSIDDLADAPKRTTYWEGVRNYQARNYMRDEVKNGDRVLFYHHSTEPSAVVGTAVVVGEPRPDPTAWDKKNQYFDPKASPDNPIWQMVDIRLEQVFKRPVTLQELRETTSLAEMELLKRGSRLSIQPVTKSQFDTILKMAGAK